MYPLGDATGILWVAARDAIEYPLLHRASPRTKNYSVQNVSSTMVNSRLNPLNKKLVRWKIKENI